MSQRDGIHGEALEQFRSYLYLLARANLRPHATPGIEASDLVQQTLMDAHAKRDQFRGDGEAQLACWLRKILAHNLADALKHQGRAKRDAARQRSLEAAIDESFSRADDWLAASQSSPSEQFTRKEDLLRLTEAMSKLPPAQQDAIVLHHLQGRTLSASAAEMGRSEAAVAGLLHRGLKRLHQLLEERD